MLANESLQNREPKEREEILEGLTIEQYLDNERKLAHELFLKQSETNVSKSFEDDNQSN